MTEQSTLSEMPLKYLKCRRRGRHNFPDPEDRRVRWTAGVVDGLAVVVMRYPCSTCGTVRTEEVVRGNGEFAGSPGYKHPDGYLLAPGERINRAEVRLEMINRLISEKLK